MLASNLSARNLQNKFVLIILLALTGCFSRTETAAPPSLPQESVPPSVSRSNQPEPQTTARSQEALVYYCHDGDTCRLMVAGSVWLNVRLAAIDAPEVGSKRKGKASGQALGVEARDRLNALVQNKKVTLQQVDLDHYNRPVVVLELDGKSINLQMVEEGLAEVYGGTVKRFDKSAYLAAEARAKSAKRGLWALPNYQSPSDYRRAKRAAP